MTISGVESRSGPTVPRPASPRGKVSSPRFRLLALAWLALIGGLTCAVGILGMVAARSLGLGAGIASIAGGLALSASVAIAWYGVKIHSWLEVIERLYTT